MRRVDEGSRSWQTGFSWRIKQQDDALALPVPRVTPRRTKLKSPR